MADIATRSGPAMTPTGDPPLPSLRHLAVLSLAVFLGALVTAMATAEVSRVPPAIGDIVAFRAGVAVPAPSRGRILATTVERPGVPTRACGLEPAIMADQGGSLVVEEARSVHGTVYIAHWAGGPTASGDADCGHSADLVLEDMAIIFLAQAAGGFGVDQQRLAPVLAGAMLQVAAN